MDTESNEPNLVDPPLTPETPDTPEAPDTRGIPDWIPSTGIHLRKAGVQFDAVRVDGDEGRAAADRLARMTGGAPGPIVEEACGSRAVYFLVHVGATSHRVWPPGVTTLASETGRIAYIPVPSLNGLTWPLTWRYRPTRRDHFVHALLLKAVLHPEE
ncbi:hypothetical protein [Streptomyces graminilatus]|uniref:hypothetical protein n=1 Tax=Streptomyces graminilatus TaxID=1464070 RepID=UPI001F52687F|nr:hypothetical protein [Streptomyces graminilatus]